MSSEYTLRRLRLSLLDLSERRGIRYGLLDVEICRERMRTARDSSKFEKTMFAGETNMPVFSYINEPCTGMSPIVSMLFRHLHERSDLRHRRHCGSRYADTAIFAVLGGHGSESRLLLNTFDSCGNPACHPSRSPSNQSPSSQSQDRRQYNLIVPTVGGHPRADDAIRNQAFTYARGLLQFLSEPVRFDNESTQPKHWNDEPVSVNDMTRKKKAAKTWAFENIPCRRTRSRNGEDTLIQGKKLQRSRTRIWEQRWRSSMRKSEQAGHCAECKPSAPIPWVREYENV